MRPFEIALVPILNSYIALQLEGLTCANDNRALRFYYTLDGNAVSSSPIRQVKIYTQVFETSRQT